MELNEKLQLNMQTRPKTNEEKEKDSQDVLKIEKALHLAAFELVYEFTREFFDHDYDVAQIPCGLVSRMITLSTCELDRVKIREAQAQVGDAFAENVTWKGYYS
jgi:hypothetical protein